MPCACRSICSQSDCVCLSGRSWSLLLLCAHHIECDPCSVQLLRVFSKLPLGKGGLPIPRQSQHGGFIPSIAAERRERKRERACVQESLPWVAASPNLTIPRDSLLTAYLVAPVGSHQHGCSSYDVMALSKGLLPMLSVYCLVNSGWRLLMPTS